MEINKNNVAFGTQIRKIDFNYGTFDQIKLDKTSTLNKGDVFVFGPSKSVLPDELNLDRPYDELEEKLKIGKFLAVKTKKEPIPVEELPMDNRRPGSDEDNFRKKITIFYLDENGKEQKITDRQGIWVTSDRVLNNIEPSSKVQSEINQKIKTLTKLKNKLKKIESC